MTPETVKIYTIELNEDTHHASLLKAKAQQYEQRIEEDKKNSRFSSPETIKEDRAGIQNRYALFMMRKLLDDGSVNVAMARNELIKEVGTSFDHELYNKVCGIVNMYSLNREILAQSLQK